MSDKEGFNLSRPTNPINMAENVIRRFEKVLGDVSDRLDMFDTSVAKLH